MLEVAQLMGQDGFDLAGGQLAQQGVVEHHALGGTKAREVGVGVGAAAAAVHHKQALGREAAALHECRHAGFERFIFQWLEFVEQRCDEGGVDHHQQQVETHPEAPGPQPPQRACSAHQPEDQRGNRQPDDGAHQQALEGIRQPQAPGHLVEAKPFFHHEGLVQRQGQVDQSADGSKGHQQCHLLPHAATQHAKQRLVQCIQAAQQGPAQQHGRAQRHLQHAQAGFGDGVVSRLLVCGQRNAFGKRGGNCSAVAGYMPDLAGRQPELEGQAQQQRGGKGQGEQQRGRNVVRGWHVRRV